MLPPIWSSGILPNLQISYIDGPHLPSFMDKRRNIEKHHGQSLGARLQLWRCLIWDVPFYPLKKKKTHTYQKKNILQVVISLKGRSAGLWIWWSMVMMRINEKDNSLETNCLFLQCLGILTCPAWSRAFPSRNGRTTSEGLWWHSIPQRTH